MALNGSFAVVASTLLLNNVESQSNASSGEIVGGHRVHDVRLFSFEQRQTKRPRKSTTIWATWHCHRCRTVIALVHIVAHRSSSSKLPRAMMKVVPFF